MFKLMFYFRPNHPYNSINVSRKAMSNCFQRLPLTGKTIYKMINFASIKSATCIVTASLCHR